VSGEQPVRLFLVRHGNTFAEGETPRQVGKKTDLPLTEKGEQQARRMGLWLCKTGILPEKIFAGCLQRQQKAAQIIAGQLEPPPLVRTGDDALDELDYGAWEGLTSAEIEAQWPNQYRQWNESALWPADIFGGSCANRLLLIEEWLQDLRRDCRPGETVVAVSSNGIIRFFCTFVPGMFERISAERQMKTLKVGTGNYCEMQILPDCLSVVSWNQVPPPEPEAGR